MARYFDEDRGKAIALAAIGYAFGEALLPVSGLYLAQQFGWRQTFYLVAALVFCAIALALWLLKGHARRHASHLAALAQGAAGGEPAAITRAARCSPSRAFITCCRR